MIATAAQPRERGIPFTPAMVLAILKGDKLETRRLIKVIPSGYSPIARNDDGSIQYYDPFAEDDYAPIFTHKPRYRAGDRLYVCEAFRLPESQNGHTPNQVLDMCYAAGYRQVWSPIQYEADGELRHYDAAILTEFGPVGRYRHGRFMPKALARIWLEVVEVRQERLFSVTEEGALREGFHILYRHTDHCNGKTMTTELVSSARDQFLETFHAIHGLDERNNPWVDVVKFRVD